MIDKDFAKRFDVLNPLIKDLDNKYLKDFNDSMIKPTGKYLQLDEDPSGVLTTATDKGEAFTLTISKVGSLRKSLGTEFVYRFTIPSSFSNDEIMEAVDTLYLQTLRSHIATTGANPKIIPVKGNMFLTTAIPYDQSKCLRILTTGDYEIRFYSHMI